MISFPPVLRMLYIFNQVMVRSDPLAAFSTMGKTILAGALKTRMSLAELSTKDHSLAPMALETLTLAETKAYRGML